MIYSWSSRNWLLPILALCSSWSILTNFTYHQEQGYPLQVFLVLQVWSVQCHSEKSPAYECIFYVWLLSPNLVKAPLLYHICCSGPTIQWPCKGAFNIHITDIKDPNDVLSLTLVLCWCINFTNIGNSVVCILTSV